MSINNITPEEWNKMAFKTVDDDAPNEHPRFSEKAMTEAYDVVNNPAHYNNGRMECIEGIRGMLTPEEYIGYLRGTAFAYMWRFRDKSKPVEDISKAQWYEKRLINYFLEHPGDK